VQAQRARHVRRVQQRGNKSANAVARLHQLRGLQSGNGLAHHRAADLVSLHQRRFGGQFFPRRQQAAADFAGELVKQQRGQIAPAAAGPQGRFCARWGRKLG